MILFLLYCQEQVAGRRVCVSVLARTEAQAVASTNRRVLASEMFAPDYAGELPCYW